MDEQNSWSIEVPLSADFLQFAFGRLGDGVFWFDRDGGVVYANESACRSLEYSREELLDKRAPDFDPNLCAEMWHARWEEVKALGAFTLETLHRAKSGRTFPVEATVNFFAHDGAEFCCAIVRDISARKCREDSMKLAAAIYRSSNEAVMLTDACNRIIDVNPAFTRITGYTLAELSGLTPNILRSNRHNRSFYREMRSGVVNDGHWQGELWARRKNGELFASFVTISQIKNVDGGLSRYVTQFSEITEQKRREELIWQYANYDYLTGLPNRRLFYDRLEQEIKKADRSEHALALLFVDLDDFKHINDGFGHDKGDLLLMEVARRIAGCVRGTDTVARLGGDEFTVILTDFGNRSNLERVVSHIIRELSEPYFLEPETGVVSASVGVALYPRDASDGVTLLKCADQAMYAAKKRGRNRFAYVPESGRNDDARNSYLRRRMIYLRKTED